MAGIFLTYLGISVTVGIVVILILLASPFINRRYAAKWKYYIWIFLAIRLLIPISGMYQAESKSPAPAVIDTAQSSGEVVYEPVEMPDVQPRRFVVEIPVGTVGQISQTPDVNSVRPKLSLFDIAFAAWIAGAIIFVSVPLFSCFLYKYKITHSGKIISDGEVFDTLRQTKSMLKIKRNVSLIRYRKAASPMIIGFINPALVLPCDDYSAEELQFIIRHELIHLKRGDVYIKLLCVLANALHWFNPLIWIMRKEMAIDMELSCDEGVIKGADFGVKRAYTETLMSSLRRQSSKRSSLTTQFYGGKGTMKKRFTNILSKGSKKNGIAVLIVAVVLATLLGVLVGCTQKTSIPPDNELAGLIDSYLEFESICTHTNLPADFDNPPSDDPSSEEHWIYPVTKEGMTTWADWQSYLGGIFTESGVGKALEKTATRYINYNGNLYYSDGGMGWNLSREYCIARTKQNGSTAFTVEFWREYDPDFGSSDEREFRITTLDFEYTSAGWRIADYSDRDSTPADSNPNLSGFNPYGTEGNVPEALNGYAAFDKADIPDIHYDGSIGLDELNERAFPKVLFDSKEVGGVRVYLLGEHVRTDKSQDENAVYSYYLSLGVVSNGTLVTSPVPAELEGVSQGGYILNKNALSGYLSVYGMDCPLAVLRYTSSGGAQLSAFYAVKDGSLNMLMGDSSAVDGESAGVCVPGISQDVTVSGNTLRDNASGVTYSFDFDNILADDYIGAHFVAAAGNTELTEDKMILPQGYAYNTFKGTVGHLRDNGNVGFENHDESAAFSFILPEDWSLGASVADCNDVKVFEIGGVFKTEELSPDKVMLTDGNANFPTTAKNDEGETVTIYAEKMSDTGVYDYMCHSSSVLGNGEIYEKYIYIVSRGGYSVYVTFVVNGYYSDEICETVLNSFAYVGEHFTASAGSSDVTAPTVTNLTEDEVNRLISEYLRFERYAVYGCVSFGSNDPENGVWIGDTFVQEIELDDSYHPSIEEGLTTWQQWLDFIHGIFTDETAEKHLEELTGEGKRYMNIDGNLYVLPGGDMGWPYSAPVQAGYNTNGSTGVIEFWREDFSEGYESWYYITTFDIRQTSFGWRIQSAESHDFDSLSENPGDFKPMLDKPERNSADNPAALANEIYKSLEQDYRTTVDILTMRKTEPINIVEGEDRIGNLREIDGATYVPMVEDYDTVDEIMAVFRRVYTEEKCNELYSRYLDGNSTGYMKEVDGKLYAMAIGEQGHTYFNLPISSATAVGDSTIFATTTITYDSGDVPYEITLKYEDGEWKIDKLIEYMSEEGREMSY